MSRRTLDAGLVDGGTGDWSGMLVLRLVHLPLPLAQTISGQLDHWLMSPPGRFNHLLLVSPRQHKRQAGFVAMCINVIVLEIPARVLSEPFFFLEEGLCQMPPFALAEIQESHHLTNVKKGIFRGVLEARFFSACHPKSFFEAPPFSLVQHLAPSLFGSPV